MKVKLDKGAFKPHRAHPTDAGLDIKSRETQIVPAQESATFYTGVHVKIPWCHAGLLVSKSGLLVKNAITSTGLIDEGYTGEIVIQLINNSGFDYVVNKGDKISQLVVIPVSYEDVEIVDDLPETPRGNNGFGSTGK